MQALQFQIEGDQIHNIYGAIRQQFGAGAAEYVSPSGNLFYFNFEKFSFWNNSDMSASILVDIWDPRNCYMKIVVSGGKVGLFRLDIWGREGSRLRKIQSVVDDICRHYHWQIHTGRPIPRPVNQQGTPPPAGSSVPPIPK